MTISRSNAGLPVFRFLMVMSSFAPLFVLWAIRGTTLIRDIWFLPACLFLAIVPSLVVWHRTVVARRQHEVRELVVGRAEDSRGNILVYLFAVLLPLYADPFTAWRGFAADAAALVMIFALFWRLDLHYLNIVFVLGNYRVFTLHPLVDNNPYSGRASLTLITRRDALTKGEHVAALRVTDTVYLDERL